MSEDKHSSQTEAEMVAASLKALEQYQQMSQGIPHAQVRAWLNSLSTDRPLPCPK